MHNTFFWSGFERSSSNLRFKRVAFAGGRGMIYLKFWEKVMGQPDNRPNPYTDWAPLLWCYYLYFTLVWITLFEKKKKN